jgi:hypothetical protein
MIMIMIFFFKKDVKETCMRFFFSNKKKLHPIRETQVIDLFS